MIALFNKLKSKNQNVALAQTREEYKALLNEPNLAVFSPLEITTLQQENNSKNGDFDSLKLAFDVCVGIKQTLGGFIRTKEYISQQEQRLQAGSFYRPIKNKNVIQKTKKEELEKQKDELEKNKVKQLTLFIS